MTQKKTKIVSTRVTPAQKAFLQAVGDGNISAYLYEIIKDKYLAFQLREKQSATQG